MKIQNIEESGIVKLGIICNDIFLIMLSYWLSFAFIHGFTKVNTFPFPVKIYMILGALTVIIASRIAPPLFIKRIVYGNDIFTRAMYVTTLQTFFMFVAIGGCRVSIPHTRSCSQGPPSLPHCCAPNAYSCTRC